MRKKLMAMLLCVALVITMIQGNSVPIVKAAAAPITLYDMAEDTQVNSPGVVSGASIQGTSVLTNSGKDFVVEKDGGLASLKIAGRAGNWIGVDIKREALKHNGAFVDGRYTFTVEGHVSAGDTGTFRITKATGGTYLSDGETPDGDNKFRLTYSHEYTAADLEAFGSNYRIQTDAATPDTFWIDSIVVTVVPSAAEFEPVVVYENDFESGLNGFAAQNTTIDRVSDPMDASNNALQISGGGANWHGVRLSPANSNMELDAKYEITARVYSATEQTIVMQTALAPTGSKEAYPQTSKVVNGAWTEYTLTVEIASTDYLAINYLSFENKTAPYSGTYYVDDVTITKIAELAPPEEDDEPGVFEPVSITFDSADKSDEYALFEVADNSTMELATGGVGQNNSDGAIKVTHKSGEGYTSTDNWVQLNLENPLPKGNAYNLSAWFFVPAEGAQGKGILFGPGIVLNGNTGDDGSKLPSNPGDMPVGEWKEVNVTIPARSSAIDFINFRFGTNDASKHADIWYLDSITIDRAGVTAEIDFENGEENGFTGRGSAVVAATQDEAHSGTWSLKTTGRTASWHGPALHIENMIQSGKSYEISVWVHALTPNTKTEFKLSSEVTIGGSQSWPNIVSKLVSPEDGWVELKGTITYTDASNVTIYVENSNETAEYYIDDVSIVEVAGATLRPDLAATPLKTIYANDFLIGNIFSAGDLTGVRYDLIKHHFNVLTPENAMKPEAMMNKDTGAYQFTAVDSMITTISAQGIPVIGHTLGWHQQSPERLNEDAAGNPLTKAEAETNLKTFVATVAGHYKDKLLSWDVLNEAMADDPSNPSDWRNSLRKDSPWYRAFANGGNGDDYIELIFREAREADPNAILYYNDYNLDNQNKAAAVANMVREINETWIAEGNTRLLIEGVGMQGHYNINTNVDNVERSIQRFEEIGVEVSITELDVTIPKDREFDADMEFRQAWKYAQLMSLFKEYSDTIVRVTFWGLDDGSSWRKTQYPLLFNADLSAKQAYEAVADPEGFLTSNNAPQDLILQGNASYGTPVIDGNADSIWRNVQALSVSQQLQAWQYPTGTAKVMWDSNNLYVLMEVNYSVLDKASPDVWEQSSVEVFIDERNCKAGAYGTEDGQYRVSYENLQTFGSSTDSSGFESQVVVGSGSYTVEMKIPFKEVRPGTGATIGFDAQINHAQGGARVGVVMWCDTSGQSFQNTSSWGEITLYGGNSQSDSSSEEDTYTSETPKAEISVPASQKPNIAAANDPGDTTGTWKLDGDRWWYQKKDSSYPADSWLKVNGQWYMFGKDGYMKTGWQQTADGSWFYFDDKNGNMSTGWKQTGDGKWYFMDTKAGEMKTGWLKSDDGKWYFLDTKLGEMKTGWLKSGDGKWYFLDTSLGEMKTGWLQTEDGKWYFLDTGLGEMKTGWLQTGDGKWYFLNADGSCAMNTTTPDGHRLDENGAWIEE